MIYYYNKTNQVH